MTSNPYVDGTYLKRVENWHVGDSPWKASNVYAMIEKHQLAFASVYDVGCGAGEILVELQKKVAPHVDLVGFDISPQAIEIAKPKETARLRFRNEDFLTSSVPSPDLLLMLDVFEHVPDYIGFLERLRERTAWVIFHIPLDACAKEIVKGSDHMLYMRRRYGHLHYFTKETAIATLSDVGYDVVDWFFTDDFQISDEMIPKTLKRRFYYEVRRLLFRFKPALSASLFAGYNLMLLAAGDLKSAR